MEDNERQLYDRFDSLIARHRDLIDRLCMRRALGNVSRCAELRQDCYISLWHYLPKLRENANPFHETAWVVWHCRSVFSHLRYRRRTHLFLPIDDNMADTISENGWTIELSYGGGLQREKSVLRNGNAPVCTTYFISKDCEYEIKTAYSRYIDYFYAEGNIHYYFKRTFTNRGILATISFL